MYNKIFHYLYRIKQLGCKGSFFRVQSRMRQQYIKTKLRLLAYTNNASYSWFAIAKKHSVSRNFSFFYEQKLQVRRDVVLDHLFFRLDRQRIIDDADAFVRQEFDILGSGLQQFVVMPWHEDFRLKQRRHDADTVFDPRIFCHDRKIKKNESEQLQKDIKVPWELSRLYQLPVLAKAYAYTNDMSYQQAFEKQLIDWIEQNPYLFGVNWICPMEVGIRAINIVISAEAFMHRLQERHAEQIIGNLYDHMIYLESHWETYDGRTSNHYVSNLIGYYYLCYFFKFLPDMQSRAIWCYEEIVREWDKQVFEEGTDYEGSTAYHALVTEIFSHFYFLTQQFNFRLSDKHLVKLKRMYSFIEWCTPVKGRMVTIGDNDSGKITEYGLRALNFVYTNGSIKDQQIIKQYTDFGLSMLKTDKWHVTLRGHAYRTRQPSGHFHVDIGSITVAYNGVSVIVDPGSYIYTPSIYWRNLFRSHEHHSTFFIDGIDPIVLTDQLFDLSIPEYQTSDDGSPSKRRLYVVHDLYKKYGLRAHRTVNSNQDGEKITIIDWWQSKEHLLSVPVLEQKEVVWRFMLGENIEASVDDCRVILLYRKKEYMIMESDSLPFVCLPAWTSSFYGVKQKSYCLVAKKKLLVDQKMTLVIGSLSCV